eukprot:Colp12_sorted_trinity150504_noHs@13740
MAFNAEEDAKTLRAAMKGLGTDEAAIIKVVANRSLAQRLEIKKTFKTSFGRDLIAELSAINAAYHKLAGHTLIDAIKNEFSGDAKTAMVSVVEALTSPDEYFAKRVHDAVAGLGTKDTQLIRVIVTRDEVNMPGIKAAYKKLYGKDMVQAIKDDTSGDYKKLLVELVSH